MAVFISALCAAQTVEVQVDGLKRFAVFARNGAVTEVSSNVTFSNGPTATFNTQDSTEPIASTADLYVWNLETGNVASKPLAVVGKNWHVAEKEFNRICQVGVQVEHDGQPVAVARVVLKDKRREQSQLLDPDSKGEADFYMVEPGSVTVKVEYKSKGAPATPVVQQFNLDLARKTAAPLLAISLADDVVTVATTNLPQSPNTPQTSVPEPKRTTSPIGSALVFLFTLFIAGAIAFGIYYLAKKNPDWLKGKLNQVGVDVPDAPHEANDQAPIPVLEPAKPQGPSKIILDGAALTPTASAPLPGQPVHYEPRLVKSTGEFASLPEGETVVGREENLGISLVGESSVSRRHASITRQGSLLTLRDLGSTNGTFVNGRRVNADTQLSPGDDVQFGAVKFRVEAR